MSCLTTKGSSITFVNLGCVTNSECLKVSQGSSLKVCFALSFIKEPGLCLKMNPQLESCFQF